MGNLGVPACLGLRSRARPIASVRPCHSGSCHDHCGGLPRLTSGLASCPVRGVRHRVRPVWGQGQMGPAQKAKAIRGRLDEPSDSSSSWASSQMCPPGVSDAAPVLLVGVPRDLEEMTIGIGEVPGVDAEGAHMSGGGQRASSGFDLPEQLVDLCP